MEKRNNYISFINSINDQMVEIKSGEIELRDDRIKRKWKVRIQQFLIAKYPLSQDLYFEITKQSPSSFKGEKNPVENVSWKDAVCFCNLLSIKAGLQPYYSINDKNDDITYELNSNGYRLPSEAEWEYACKAGSTETRYGELREIAWYKENSDSKTHKVGTKKPNERGLYDMLGNVWEWCSDIYDETVYGSYRIFRGGGWCDETRSCMATNRRRSHPISFKIDDLGFRLARNLN